jgi:hypothetical protein
MTRPVRLAFALLLLCPLPALAQANVPPPSEDRFGDFVRASVLSPGPYVLDLGAAIIDHGSEFPEEWELEDHPFVRRFGARLASGFVSDAVGHSIGAVLHHRVLYEACACTGGWRRTMHALGRGFVNRHDDGRVVPNVSIFVAKFSAAGVANAWYPDSYTTSDVVREGVIGVGANAGLNVLREFGPDLMRLLGMR